jgi:hypothetical protein
MEPFTVKLLFFVLFLAAFVAWVAINAVLVPKLKNPSFGKSIWGQELLLIVNYGAFFLFLYTLSGFWNWWVVLLTLASAQLGFVITGIFWGLLGATDDRWYARSRWAGDEFAQSHTVAGVSVMILMALFTFAYPVVAGITYFRHSASELTISILQYTLIVFFFGGLCVMLPILIGALTSKNLDENTRTRFLAAQLGGMFSNALFVALALLAFRGAGETTILDLSGPLQVKLSFQVAIVLLIFFFLVTLLPFLIGTLRAGRWRAALAERQRNLFGRVALILKTPSAAGYEPKLDKLQDDLARDAASFRQDNDIEKAEEAAKRSVNTQEEYDDIRELDPRIRHLEWLQGFAEQVNEARSALSQAVADGHKVKVAATWAKSFEAQESAADKQPLPEPAKTAVVVAFIAITGPIMSAILSGIGEKLWDAIAKFVELQ